MAMLRIQPKRLIKQYWQSSFFILVILLGLVSDRTEAQQSDQVRFSTQVCGDFLARWDKKPAALKFVRCETRESEQVDRRVSLYAVKGSDAVEAEKFLQRQFGMSPLQFICCGWSPSPIKNGVGQYVDTKGAEFKVSMYGGETLVQDRKDWHKIPEFRIRVITDLKEF